MSEIIQLLDIRPEKGNRENKTEVFTLQGYDCPWCGGRGFFDNSGWIRKFKKNLDDPDFVECERCKGAAKLRAKIIIEWAAEDLPSHCPPNDEE